MEINMLKIKSRVKKGDTVMVVTGKEKNKTGKLLQVIAKDGNVLVEGLNIVKRHVRARGSESGTIVEKEAPINISNVQMYCAKCNKAVRTRINVLEDKMKVRVCVKCGESFDK
jgi:large subunit ribosomal protein L24